MFPGSTFIKFSQLTAIEMRFHTSFEPMKTLLKNNIFVVNNCMGKGPLSSLYTDTELSVVSVIIVASERLNDGS